MILETRTVLVLFRKSVEQSTIEKLLDEFGPSFLQWAQVLKENPLYAIQVDASQAIAWKDALAQLPDVVWTECTRTPTFRPDRIV